MVKLLAKAFIKNPESYEDSRVRRAYGVLCSLLGIFLNLLLFAGKYVAGVVSGSIAVTADAFNNLSDAASSVITLLGFSLAAKKPDLDHPFGHGRIEYLSGVAVSLLIIVVGVQLGRDSIAKIISPQPIEAGLLPIIILIVSILVKGYMYLYNRAMAKKLNSPGMSATATDSISDCVATTVVLVSMLIARFWGVNIDGWSGAAVALFIIWSGFMSARDTISPLLGSAPSPELVQKIYDIVLSHPEVVNIHDLMVHDYGPGRLMISLHAEVLGDGDIFALHDAIDTAEYELAKKLGCQAVIHMDPISTDDSKVSGMYKELLTKIAQINPEVSIHDFRIVDGPTHTNVIFDAVLPLDSKMSPEELKSRLEALVHELWDNSHPKIQIDKPYI